MAEWSNAAVLKTVDRLSRSGGSNPSSSAKQKALLREQQGFVFLEPLKIPFHKKTKYKARKRPKEAKAFCFKHPLSGNTTEGRNPSFSAK